MCRASRWRSYFPSRPLEIPPLISVKIVISGSDRTQKGFHHLTPNTRDPTHHEGPQQVYWSSPRCDGLAGGLVIFVARTKRIDGHLSSCPHIIGSDDVAWSGAHEAHRITSKCGGVLGLVAPYRAILRYYRCDSSDTPYRAILFKLHRHICAIPHFATYRAIIVRYPIRKNKHEMVSAILSLQVSRDMKSIAAGPGSWAEICGRHF